MCYTHDVHLLVYDVDRLVVHTTLCSCISIHYPYIIYIYHMDRSVVMDMMEGEDTVERYESSMMNDDSYISAWKSGTPSTTHVRNNGSSMYNVYDGVRRDEKKKKDMGVGVRGNYNNNRYKSNVRSCVDVSTAVSIKDMLYDNNNNTSRKDNNNNRKVLEKKRYNVLRTIVNINDQIFHVPSKGHVQRTRNISDMDSKHTDNRYTIRSVHKDNRTSYKDILHNIFTHHLRDTDDHHEDRKRRMYRYNIRNDVVYKPVVSYDIVRNSLSMKYNI